MIFSKIDCNILIHFLTLFDIIGPLTRLVNETATLYGIVSWGRKTCDMHSVYSKVSHPMALNWIRKLIRQN